jgi:hypothetical protein
VLFFALGLLLSACTPTLPTPAPPAAGEPTIKTPLDPDPAPTDDQPGRVRVLSPIHISNFVLNKLSFEHFNKYQGSSSEMTFSILGLRNKEIEDLINDDLRALYQDMKERDLPPYRGIKVQIPKGSTLYANNLHAHVTFNHNNVLSILIQNNRLYSKPGSYYHLGVDIGETRNYDLNTGRQITLRDLFTDDVNHLKVIGDFVGQQLIGSTASEEDSYEWFHAEPPKLVAPFKGIGEEQIFYITGQGLNLVFDYRTPEFDTYFSTRGVNIPFQDLQGMLALTKRYESEASLYTDDSPPVKELMQHPYEAKHVRLTRDEKDQNVYVSASLRYSSQAHEAVAAFAEAEYLGHKAKVTQLQKEADSEWAVIHRVYTESAGPFTTVTVNQEIFEVKLAPEASFDMYHFLHGREGLVASFYQSYCFDGEGQERSLGSLFVPGFDYKSAILRYYEKELESYTWVKDTPTPEEFWQDIQFVLDTSFLRFQTRPVDWDGHYSPFTFGMPFEDLGCENMVIFD